MTSKMSESHRVSLSILVTIVFAVVSKASTQTGEKEFSFMKTKSEDVFDFEYKTDDGNVLQGRTLSIQIADVHIMVGADDVFYWTKIKPADFDGRQSVAKIVRPASRTDKEISFQDEFYTYTISLTTGDLYFLPYLASWDVEHICFTKSITEENLFDYTILSTNNARKYNGTTYLEAGDPFVQRIHLEDLPQYNGIYEVVFTKAELALNNTFCKSISESISISLALGAAVGLALELGVLKSLVG